MTAYQTCQITPEIIKEALDICVQYSEVRAGICCSSLITFADAKVALRSIQSEGLSYSTERLINNYDGLELRLCNGSVLEIFVCNSGVRGRSFHLLRVDENIGTLVQEELLKPLVRKHYLFSGDTLAQKADLFDFAEATLDAPLQPWQMDMLDCLFTGRVYITGRRSGKQQMLDIYKAWLVNLANPSDTLVKSYDVTYTYEQLMTGVPYETNT